jgi:uncharacterized protein DUF1918
VPAKKTTGRKSPVKKVTGKKVTGEKVTTKKTVPRGSSQPGKRRTMAARPGDRIVIDSPQVGSMPREGEVLQVIQGQVSVSYRVRWADGHQTLITPMLGAAHIVPGR